MKCTSSRVFIIPGQRLIDRMLELGLKYINYVSNQNTNEANLYTFVSTGVRT